MTDTTFPIHPKVKIARVAHDNKKQDLLEWAKWNKAIPRIAVVWNIPVAWNRASADFIISSMLMTGEYQRIGLDYEPYRERQVEALVADKMDELEGK